jgi:large subunit ribosomal protein L34
MPKRTYQPSARKKVKTHGFRSRNISKKRKKVIKRRILKGRNKLF